MSLARAFTKRREKRVTDAASLNSFSVPQTPIRSSPSVRDSVRMINRTQISAPVALLSTTNMLSYNAPDIAVYRAQKKAETVRQVSSSSSSTHSSNGDESDRSSISNQTKDSLLTDNSSVDYSPTERSPSPSENHLSRYFPNTKTVRRSVSANDMVQRESTSTTSTSESPAIPQRAPSHSKRAHEVSLARKRSLQTWDRESTRSESPSLQSAAASTPSLHSRNISAQSSRSSTNTRSLRDSTGRSSLDIFRSTIDPNHPFGKELEQLNEVAEEFVDTVRDAEWEADAHLMKQRNLARYCANDYLVEISPLFTIPKYYPPLVSTDGGFF